VCYGIVVASLPPGKGAGEYHVNSCSFFHTILCTGWFCACCYPAALDCFVPRNDGACRRHCERSEAIRGNEIAMYKTISRRNVEHAGRNRYGVPTSLSPLERGQGGGVKMENEIIPRIRIFSCPFSRRQECNSNGMTPPLPPLKRGKWHRHTDALPDIPAFPIITYYTARGIVVSELFALCLSVSSPWNYFYFIFF
jgi:hypothetical protein